MTLQPDQMLSHYRLVEKIGEGGMGVVWKAEDTSLHRDVAIKILPDTFAAQPERLARFEREARLLASLNHPGIAVVHGLHEAKGVRFLAMELVPGEDLAKRLAVGPLPLNDALEVALQIAEALEAAHSQGVIHRDLKPANIVLTAEGRTKVLDFGLAKSLGPDAASGPGGAGPSLSPTVTAGTMAGVILGTAAYMSPEQARGQSVDKRADIWSFGCVLYEMLFGSRPFTGDTVPDTMARILEREPDMEQFPPGLPRRIRDLLRRCLAKKPKNRLHDIADVRIEIHEALSAPQEDQPAAPAVANGARPVWWAAPAWIAAGVVSGLVVGLAASIWWFGGTGGPGSDAAGVGLAAPVPIQRSSIRLAESAPVSLAAGSPYGVSGNDLALSPDGSRLVYVAYENGVRRLRLRDLDSFEVRPLSGTEEGELPFFSPDGAWVAFFTEEHLKKVHLDGGDPVTLCEARVPFSQGSWADDGWIYYVHHESNLARVREDGGTPEPVGVSGEDLAVKGRDLQVLPDGKGLLLSSNWLASSLSYNHASIAHLSPETGEVTKLLEGGFNPHFIAPGHLVFGRRSGLYGVPFDLDRLKVTGDPVRLIDGIWADSIWGVAQFDVSHNGTLVYIPGEDWSRSVPTWIGTDGSEEPLPVPPQSYGTFELSPDRTRMASHVLGPLDQIHIYDSARRSFNRLTLEGENMFPVWMPDGRQVIFGYVEKAGDEAQFYRLSVEGGGSPERVFPPATSENERGEPEAISPDGKVLIYSNWSGAGSDLWMRPLDGSGEPEPFLVSPYGEWGARFSPDGRWVAYISDKSGPYEIYVRPFPADDREWQLSTGGGEEPRWSADGTQLFYRRNRRIMAVPISVEESGGNSPALIAGTPRVGLETTFHNSMGLSFDVNAGGDRFLVNKPVAADRPVTEIRLVTGWIRELRDRVR